MGAFHSRGLFSLLLCLFVCAAFAQTSQAAGRVQGFEAGDPAFSSIGDAGTQGTFQGEAPPEGNLQYLITTVGFMRNEDQVNPPSGDFAVSNMALQSFLNVSLSGQEGSAALIPFTVSAGDSELTFQYDFLSNENFQMVPHNDFAFATLSDSNGSLLNSATLASVFGSSFTVFDAGNSAPFQFHTGFQTFTLSVASLAPGDYMLGVGVEDAGSPDHASALLFDNVQIGAIPEPSPIGLAIAGAVMLIAVRKRIKRA